MFQVNVSRSFEDSDISSDSLDSNNTGLKSGFSISSLFKYVFELCAIGEECDLVEVILPKLKESSIHKLIIPESYRSEIYYQR